MAENQEDRQTDDLSDEASPYKLEEYRRKGRVSQSRELTGLLALLGAGSMLYMTSGPSGEVISGFMREVFNADFTARLNFSDSGVIQQTMVKALKVLGQLVLPMALIGFVVGALGSFIQIGAIFSTEPLSPDLNKVNPVNGLKKMFSMRQMLDGIRMILKAATLAYVAYLLLKSEIIQAPSFLLRDPQALFTGYGDAGFRIFLALVGVLFVFSGFDFWLNRWEYGKSVRLTKKEAKEEHKEHEGDPLIRARIRSIQRETARKRMMQAVKTADVIVTNPTHIAVALVYDREKMAAPKVVAKGADFLAQKIKKIAAESGVPMVENVPLARTLFKTVKVGQTIPRALYQAVAEVLAYVLKLKNKAF